MNAFDEQSPGESKSVNEPISDSQPEVVTSFASAVPSGPETTVIEGIEETTRKKRTRRPKKDRPPKSVPVTEPRRKKPSAKKKTKVSWWTRLNAGRKNRDYFMEQLAMMLDAGMDVLNVLETMQEDARSGSMKKIASRLHAAVDSGVPFSQAVDDSRLLQGHVVSLIRIGEQSGKLAENLDVIVRQQEKDRIFRSKIRSAMMYPVFVMGLTVIIGVGIAWFILPQLSQVFGDLGVDLPQITQYLIQVGDFFAVYGQYAVPAILLGLLLVLYVMFINSRTKVIGQWLLMKLPGVSKLLKQVELARMGYMLGTLLDAGLPIDQATESLKSATALRRYRKLYGDLHEAIVQGDSIKQFFAQDKRMRKLVPVPIQQMIVVAEQSGSLPQTLSKIGQTFEAKTDTTTKNLSVVLEPILLVVVWGGVVLVALSVVLPIYSLIGGLDV